MLPHICAEAPSLVVPYSVPSVRSSIIQQNTPTILIVYWHRPHAYVFHWIDGHSYQIHKLLWSPRLLFSGHSVTTLHRTSDPFLYTSVSNTIISIRHNVPIEIQITTAHNPHLPMRYTTYISPLIFPPATTLLPIRFRRNDSNTIDTSTHQPYVLVLPSLLTH